ncbi:MAG: hypothetical protein E7289_06725 [Lachnospiraceae bacterium]|nr:hypothetical protein [Lachnospiraceae bacterium]
MKTFKSLKKIVASFVAVFAFALFFNSADVDAKVTTIVEKDVQTPSIVEVGDSVTYYDVSGMKINKKSVKKMKSKVKNIVLGSNSTGVYIPASYYSQNAYSSYTAYLNAQNNFKYIGTTDYEFTFKKTGTYTFTWYTYRTSTSYVQVPGKDYGSYDVTVTKVAHTKKYKVVKNSNILKSITLGKAKVTSSRTAKDNGSRSGTTVANYYLSGSSGKIKVSLNSPYKVMSIIVKTYDAEGNAVYQQVKNKGKVVFGKYVRDDSYIDSYDSKYNSITKDLMKETEVYIAYKNTFTGEYTKHVLKTDAYGRQYVECQYKYYNDPQVYTGNGTGGNCVLSYTFYKK